VDLSKKKRMIANVIKAVKKDSQTQTDIDLNDSESETAIIKKQRRQYRLIYRRFKHCRPDMLRKFHKVISIKKPIKIPLSKYRICPICKLIKIRNLTKKKLTISKRDKLKLIYINITKLFIKTL